MADLVFNHAITVQTQIHVFAMPQHNTTDELRMKLSIIKDATWRAIERQTSEKTT